MKVYHLILTATLFLFSYSLSHGQSMLKEGNQWNVLSFSVFGQDRSTQLFSVNGDTIVNGVAYATLFTTRDTSGNNWVLHDEFIREDTTGKVFLKEPNREEVLLLDFGMQLGEVFKVFSPFSGDFVCDLEVMQVDSVALNNGMMRKRLLLKEENGGEATWIEGIGSLQGPLFRLYCFFDINTFLLCFSEEDELLFPESPDFCFDQTTSVQNQLPADVQVYPNPIQKVLHVEFRETIIKSYMVMDLLGQVILSGTLSGNSVDMSNVPEGTFVILLEARDGKVYSQKLVKID